MSWSDLFVSNAHAQAAAAPPSAGILDFLPLIVLAVVFYFFILRPQQVRAKEHRVMLEALQKGDEVVVLSGALGRVVKVGESYVSVEVAEGVILNIQKGAIQTVLPKGTIKSI